LRFLEVFWSEQEYSFPVILCFSIGIHIRIHLHFSTFSECWQVAPPTVACGPPSATFSTLAETSS